MLQRPLVTSLVLLFGVLLVGVLGYMGLEGWSFLDALWMVVISLTTIGYGEVHPLSASGRVFTIVLIMGGVSVGAYAIGAATRAILEGDLAAELRRRRRIRTMDKLKDHYIVIGYGRLGRSVAQELKDAGVPFCVVDREPARIAEAEALLKVPAIVGDGAEDAVLREAGIARARGVAVAAGMGAESVFATLSVRQLNPNCHIVTRVETGTEVPKALRAGANNVVNPYAIGGWRMAHGLIRPNASHFLDLATLAANEEIVLDELVLAPSCPMIGKSLRDLRVRELHQVSVVALRRADGAVLAVPGAETVLMVGDIVIVVGTPQGVRTFAAMLQIPTRPGA